MTAQFQWTYWKYCSDKRQRFDINRHLYRYFPGRQNPKRTGGIWHGNSRQSNSF